MRKLDLVYAVVAAYLIAIFLLPTLVNTNTINQIPYPYVILFVLFPIATVIGVAIASIVGKKMAILWQLAKFGLVGVLNTAIDFGILNFLISISDVTKGSLIIAMNALAFSIATINSYLWNKEWVFSSRKKNSLLSFVVVSVLAIAINSVIVYGLTTYVSPILIKDPKLWANLSKVFATGVSMVWNFLGYKLIVFKR